MLFDSHAHLNADKFNEDRHDVIMRAKESGVDLIMNPGADFESSQMAIELSKRYDFIYAAVGVHPHDAKDMDAKMLLEIEAMAHEDKVQAIGEIGLDYHYDFSPREVQKKWFREQLRLASKLDMPVIIHDREAHQDVMTILMEEKVFETGVLMHCFSGSAELMDQYIKLGAYISIAGPITFKNNKKTVKVVEQAPLDRLMIETDSPYLTPVPFRGKRNESAYVRYVCERIAELRGDTVENIAKATKENAMRFFKIEG